MKGMDSISCVDTMRRRQEAGRYVGSGKAGMITLPSLMHSWEPRQPPLCPCVPSWVPPPDLGILLTSVLPENPPQP